MLKRWLSFGAATRNALHFILVLLPGLGLLVAGVYMVLTSTTREWVERDLALRARLAIHATEQVLVNAWGFDQPQLLATLNAIARDERIMAAAACTRNGQRLAATAFYPPNELSCSRIMKEAGVLDDAALPWSELVDLSGGRVHASVVPVRNELGSVGAVVLVHDLAFLGGREEAARWFLIVSYFVLALLASGLTFLIARVTRQAWMKGLRQAISGDAPDEFQPLMRDVRALAERLSGERGYEARIGPWSPERLRSALAQYLQGERVIVLANREPYVHEHSEEGIRVLHPASGLVTAIEPVMRACSGVWVAHGSGSADRATVDAKDRVLVPPGEQSYQLRRVWLTPAEEDGYYYGFANEGLWPLCHVAHARPTFRAEDYEHYVRVNRRFADAVCSEADSDDPIILVQDYHFALAPKMIRERLPKATILTFWHIPWPNAERFGICPWREELISGLLGSSILGFHTQQHCNNFIDSVDAFMESRIDRELQGVVQQGRRTLVRPYPISIEWPVHWLEGVPAAAAARSQVLGELGLPPNTLLGVGVDRLDYTKGIEERLSAVDQLLERHPEFRGRFSFVQLAAPSRTKIPRYQELTERVEQLARQINARWSGGACPPIVLLRSHHEPSTVFRYYRAADLCYVSSLHDGMNLVAKEFVAARDDERGVLVLSQFTGAARELADALIVNPYDLRQTSAALATALKMSVEEQAARMRSMRRLVSEFNVYRWAGRMLIDAAEVRRRERMQGQLHDGGSKVTRIHARR